MRQEIKANYDKFSRTPFGTVADPSKMWVIERSTERIHRYRRGYIVERTIARLHSFRRGPIRFDRDMHIYDGFVCLACAFIALDKF